MAEPVESVSETTGDSNDVASDESATSLFASGQPLAEVRLVATGLEAVETPGDAACETAAERLDGVGMPNDLARVAASVDDPIVQEAVLEQQAALSSLFAACRGDAPVSVAEAAEELRASNEALDLVLGERGID